MYIDSHAHLDMLQFDADRDQVLARAQAAGVETILTIGGGPGSLDCAIRLAERHSLIFATVGIHPHEARLAHDEEFRQLASLARHPRVVAWGEIGLDYFYDHSPRRTQRAVFQRQMELAQAARLPIVVHCRDSAAGPDAWDECLDLLRRYWAPSRLGGILHCFTGQAAHAEAALEMGFLVSFAGNITFAKADEIRRAAQMVPQDRILIETDSPYLAPVPHRGKRNEPAWVREVARQIGELRGLSAAEVGRQATENFYRFFPAARRPSPDANLEDAENG